MSFPYRAHQAETRAGDLIQLESLRGHKFLLRLQAGKQQHTHNGVIDHDALIGLPWGSRVSSHTGTTFLVLQPALDVVLLKTRRRTQILFPKDIGYIILKLGVGPGQRILEAGSGSGALTAALAHFVGDSGHIYSYEVRPEFSDLARQNLVRLDLEGRVSLKVQDISEGIAEENLDAVFFDLPGPEAYLAQAWQGLKGGGFFGCILPTSNQVAQFLEELDRRPFGCVEVCETLLRFYKPVPARLRPVDRMVAHTGYLIFARKLQSDEIEPTSPE